MSYLLTDYPSYTNGFFSNLSNNYGYILFTSNSSITFQKNTNCDLLVIGAGGRGGIGYYSGGGGAGEVIYYPSYTFTSNFYNIQIGLDSPITSNRITKISTGTTEIIKAIGGGNGAYNIIRQYPPKLFNSESTEISTTLNSISCFRQDITLDTTDITDGSGIYEIYYSTRFNNSGITYGGYNAFNYITNANTGEFGSITGGYRTTTPFDYIGTIYLAESTYKGEFLCIKMPVPIVITSYSIYHMTNTNLRAPKNFRLYASNDGINWITLQTITNSVYDTNSFIYKNKNY